MSNKKSGLDLKLLTGKFDLGLVKARRFSPILFICLVAILYGFIVFRISSLGNAQPSSDAVTSQVQSAQVPHIDKSVVQQLNSLQDHSVNVQTLFNNARSNPFQ